MMTPFEWVVGDSSKDHTVTALPPTAAAQLRATPRCGALPSYLSGPGTRLPTGRDALRACNGGGSDTLEDTGRKLM